MGKFTFIFDVKIFLVENIIVPMNKKDKKMNKKNLNKYHCIYHEATRKMIVLVSRCKLSDASDLIVNSHVYIMSSYVHIHSVNLLLLSFSSMHEK